ncbi:hypothetical protein ACFPRL_06060 [Pseudoclavibacter helvolus]
MPRTVTYETSWRLRHAENNQANIDGIPERKPNVEAIRLNLRSGSVHDTGSVFREHFQHIVNGRLNGRPSHTLATPSGVIEPHQR